MRKFARSIGSEGKSQGQKESQCPLTLGRFVAAVLGLASFAHCMRPSCIGKATFPRGVKPSPLGTGLWLAAAPEIANSELLTAGNPTV
jgi:hypothetical protein